MANAFYYATKYFSNGTSSAAPTAGYEPIPACTSPGEIRFFQDSFTASAVLATTDKVYLARIPAGHIPLRLELCVDGDLDTGANTLAVKIGTTADDDLLTAGHVIGTGDSLYVFPSDDADGIAFGTTAFAKAQFTTSAPSTDYDLTLIPTVAATTSSTGTGRFRLYYTSVPTLYDPQSSPAAVAGTQ